MKERILKLRHSLGPLGSAAIALLALAALFHVLVLQPLEAKQERLAAALELGAGRASAAASASSNQANAADAAEKIAALYRFLGEKEQPTTDSLAKLYAAGKATGVELQSANYRAQKAAGRIERYEIVLPVSGSYAQIRDFLGRALAELPALSLDQLTLRRESRNQAVVQAELRLTLHQVKP
jgi:Tfp pilus assembly protein PilO